MRRYTAVLAMAILSSGALGAAALPLVTDGQPSATLVAAAEPAPIPIKDTTVRFAAELIRDYVRQATGAELPIVAPGAPTSGTLIVVGDTPATRAAGIDPTALPAEGYVIRTVGNTVYIVGEISAEGVDRGTTFGACDFLERVAGIRWYFPGDMGTVVPEAKSLTIPELDVAQAPAFAVRYGGVGHWRPDVAREWYPVLRFGIHDGLLTNHTFGGWNDLYGKEHPEYFGMRADGTRAATDARHKAGQSRAYLCYSEPGVLRQYLANVDAWFAKGDAKGWQGASSKPRGDLVPFGPNDNRDICRCPVCAPQVDEDRGKFGRGSNLIFGFVKRAGEALKERHPQAVLWTLAYDHYQLAPSRIDTLPDNLGVTLCLIPTVVQMNHPGVEARNRALVDRWSELLHKNPRRMIVWDYFCYPNGWFTAPTECGATMKKHINYLRDKALGIFNNGFNPRTKAGDPRLLLTYRIVWLMHQLLWNPDLDLDAARHQWCHDLYGPAGPQLDAVYKLLEDRWENVDWAIEPKLAYVGESSIYGETYTPEVISQLDALLQQARVATAPDTVYRRRLDWLIENQFDPFFAEARTYHTSVGVTPEYLASVAPEPPAVDGSIADAVWATAPYVTLGEHCFGKPEDERSCVRLLQDEQALYVAAEMEVADPATVVAAATGPRNPAVERDDMFIVHLFVPDAEDYYELAVNPGGSFATDVDAIDTRGYFPTHRAGAWTAADVAVASRVVEHTWTVELAIPWTAVPGLAARPEQLRVQFIRWDRKYRHLFHCWSPLLSSWDYPVARFGWVRFSNTPTRTVELAAVAEQTGYFGAIGDKPAQPDAVNDFSTEKNAIIVGQRDLNEKKWLELRAIAVFDLAGLREGKVDLRRATLQVTHVNAVSDPPWDTVVVDHLALPTGGVASAAYSAEPLAANVGPILPAARAGTRGDYQLDVTECIAEDLRAGRDRAVFRLRIPAGVTQQDGKIHFLAFTDTPKVIVEVVP